MLAFDKWVGNCDGRQVVFTRPKTEPFYQMTGIDQGYCFNAAEWTFPDQPLHGIYSKAQVYAGVTGWDSFEPTLTEIEEYTPDDLWEYAAEIPEAWYEGNADALSTLLEVLHRRRSRVRDLISSFRDSCRRPFPDWKHQ